MQNRRTFDAPTVPEMEPIDKTIARFVADRNLYVLREKGTGKALNVSFTEEGLQWSTSSTGGLIYYSNAKLCRHEDIKASLRSGKPEIRFVTIESRDGKPLQIAPDVYVERFSPRDVSGEYITKTDPQTGFSTAKLLPLRKTLVRVQVAEYTWLSKAYRLLSIDAGSFEA